MEYFEFMVSMMIHGGPASFTHSLITTLMLYFYFFKYIFTCLSCLRDQEDKSVLTKQRKPIKRKRFERKMLNSFMNTVHLKCQWVNMVGGQLEMEIHAFYLEMKVYNSRKQLLKFIIIAHKRDSLTCGY